MAMGKLRPALARLYWTARSVPVVGTPARIIHKAYVLLHSAIYRLTDGKIAGKVEGVPLLVLSTRGRFSGKWRSSPLMYLKKGEAFVVVASAGGSKTHPNWFLNLRANPHAVAEVNGDRREITVREASPEERTRLWPELVRLYWGWGEYQRRTDRQFPIVLLEPRK
jgi:deazaflavin-dependent oxidoreductase (nitroreductase family)